MQAESVHQLELARWVPNIKPSQKGTGRTEEIQTRTVGQGGAALGAGQSREVKISIWYLATESSGSGEYQSTRFGWLDKGWAV